MKTRKKINTAEAVCSLYSEENILDLLTSLVENSLLQAKADRAGESRFTFLEKIREFALELLESSGGAEAMRIRHVNFFGSYAKTSEHELLGSGQPLILNRLDDEGEAVTRPCSL
jgi:predicted ATPase